ncbi:MAG: glycosyltransferase family 4 protein [Oscillibacter sp.]|nr:glycosyltransferase family 4 protein [Oscillibacter sp.]
MRVVQLLSTLSFGDAVSNDAIALKKLLSQMGFSTGIYAENVDRRLPRGTGQRVEEMPPLSHGDVLIYHLSIGTELNYHMDQYHCRKLMIYHNVTPPAFLAPYSRISERLCLEGLEGMLHLRDTFDECLAVSDFNRRSLLHAGYTCPIEVRPILIPFEDYEREPDKETVERYSDGWTNILFVGRVVPNKKHEDIIRAFACYKKTVNPKSRLILAGSSSGMELYKKRLEDYIAALGVEDVVFPGHSTFEQILAFYRTAHVFLCMSEHEGFCVPLVEAMYFNVPIVAYAACAVPDTLGGSGILLQDKDPVLTAAAIDRLVTNEALRASVLEKQRRQLEHFSYETVSALFQKQFETFLKREN